MNIEIKQQLNPNEKEIFEILLNVSKKYFGGIPVRVAGGWVRDRILGKESNDIDIMLEDVSGHDFALAVSKYLNSKDPHLIKANPEKSKFLETAKTYIPLKNGETIEVDFARARQEVYTDGSRIPSTKPATAAEDAFRRDLTINSLFYNINEDKIEDFTGHGIKDLITKTIRTPKEPLQTFLEDPLRVFRTIRFAAKYNGEIDDKTFEAIQNPKIVEAIQNKLAQERIGDELQKILKNSNPEKAIRLLKDSGLLETLLSESIKGTEYENKLNPLDSNQRNPNHELSLWEHTFQVIQNTLNIYKDAEPEKRVVMLLSALTHDLGKLAKWIPIEKENNEKHPDYGPYLTYKGHEDESAKISEILLKYLKLDKYVKPVSELAKNHMRAHSLDRSDSKEKALRKYIRQMGEATLDWMDAYQLSLADALSKKTDYDEEVYRRYDELRKRLEFALNSMVQGNQSDSTILDGNEIMTALNIKPGPIIKEIKEYLKDLQDDNPQISKEEALQEVKNKFVENEVNVESSKKENNKESSVVGTKIVKKAIECPKHLLKNKYFEIQDLLDDKKYLQAQNILTKDLLEQYPLDERIQRVTSDLLFKMLCNGHNNFDLNVINYVLSNAEKDFCDPILNGNAFGILLVFKSNLDESLIIKMGEKSLKLSPTHTLHVLNQIPKNAFHYDIKEKLIKKIQKES